MTTSPTLLVTGATGGVGGALMQALQDSPATVLAGSPSGRTLAGRDGRPVDFGDAAGLERAFSGVDTLFLLFPLVPGKLDLARNAVHAARRAGVRHIVRSSGAGADAASPMALSRLQGEIDQLIVDSGIPTTLLRPNNFMQNFVTYFAGMVKDGSLYFAHADARISYVDVRDVASVAATVMADPGAHAGQAYTLTGPQALGDAEVAGLIGSAIGRDIRYVAVPDEAATAAMKSSGMNEWNVEMMASLNRVVAAGDAAAVTDHVERVTGRPARSFAAFAREHASAWR